MIRYHIEYIEAMAASVLLKGNSAFLSAGNVHDWQTITFYTLPGQRGSENEF